MVAQLLSKNKYYKNAKFQLQYKSYIPKALLITVALASEKWEYLDLSMSSHVLAAELLILDDTELETKSHYMLIWLGLAN